MENRSVDGGRRVVRRTMRRVLAGVWLGMALLSADIFAAESWLYAKTANFEVLSATSEKEAQLLIGKLELFRENFIGVLPGPPFHQTRTTLVLFDKDKAFAPYRPLRDGREQSHLKSIMFTHEDEVLIGLCADGSIRQRAPILYHNYVNLLAKGRGYNLPPWLKAGLAGFYETIEIEENEVTVGRRHKGHVEVLSSERWMTLPYLLAVNHDSAEHAQTRFFAQSWALVHYLLMTSAEDVRWKNLNQLIAVLQTGMTSRDALKAVYGKTADQIGAEVSRYVKETGKYAVQTFPRSAGSVGGSAVVFRPATDFERELTLTNLRWRSRQSGDSAYRVLQLAEAQPGSPRPHELLGSITQAGGEPLRAADYWKEAVRLGTDNPILPVWLAKESLRQYLAGVSVNFRLPAGEAEELRGWLDKAVALDADYAEAWDWLALTEAFSERTRPEVIRDLQSKRTVWGSRPRVIAALALIALRAGNIQVAEALSDAVMKDLILGVKPSENAAMRMIIAESRGVGGLWTPFVDKGSEVLDLARVVKVSALEEKARAHNRARAK